MRTSGRLSLEWVKAEGYFAKVDVCVDEMVQISRAGVYHTDILL